MKTLADDNLIVECTVLVHFLVMVGRTPNQLASPPVKTDFSRKVLMVL